MEKQKLSVQKLEKELRLRVEGEVRFDRASLAVYSTDASNYRLVPLGVVIPRHEGDVIAAVELAHENSVPVLPRGGGTSLAGQTCNSALVIDFSKYLNRVLRIDPDRGLVEVEPGVIQSVLNRALAPYGLFFAPDPTTKDRCNIGGMVGNNSCGAHSLRYGKTVDNVAELDVLLYDGTRLAVSSENESRLPELLSAPGREGEIYRQLVALRERCTEHVRSRFPKLPRRVSGYNLDELLPERGFNVAGLLTGSEGTLAITLRATLKLAPLPKKRVTVAIGCSDIFAAADQVPWLLEYHPQALEAFDERIIPLARARGLATDALALLPPGQGWLLLEVAADESDSALEQAKAVAERAKNQAGIVGARVLASESDQQAAWALRESGLGSSVAIEGMPRTWPGAEDAAVPPHKLGSYLRRFDAILQNHGLSVAVYYGHFGDGCVHCRISFPFQAPDGPERFRKAMLHIADLIVEFGGSLSGEHGDGRARSELLVKMFGSEVLEDFATLKRIFDPDNAMNPGIIVDPDRLDEHLRLSRWRRPLSLNTKLSFQREQGLDGVALGCVGIGKCRKVDSGVMCPSYMATREEIHSTRGRARLLFEALSGGLLERGFESSELYHALSLCLSCKGCKRECPAEVDMSAYKAEFLYHYHKHHRRQLNELFVGYVHELASLGMRVPWLFNFLTQQEPFSSLGKRLLHIHPARRLPRLAARPLRAWLARRKPLAEAAREVVLFVDTFTNYFEPEVGQAAVTVLERAGFRVKVPAIDLCCGRPLYDVGMLERVRDRLARILAVLSPYVEQGFYVVGLEPSCLLTFRDEMLRFFPDDPRAQSLSKRALLLEEFLLREATDVLANSSLQAKVLLHRHCHQVALSPSAPEVALLNKIKGLEVTPLDSGCCGMAGAFGYDQSRYDLSVKIGESRLGRAIKDAAPDTIVVTNGFSCRRQIEALCNGRRSLHVAQLLERITDRDD